MASIVYSRLADALQDVGVEHSDDLSAHEGDEKRKRRE
jgi:hypothetical protein